MVLLKRAGQEENMNKVRTAMKTDYSKDILCDPFPIPIPRRKEDGTPVTKGDEMVEVAIEGALWGAGIALVAYGVGYCCGLIDD